MAKKEKKKKSPPCKDAFLTNPVASAQECTGFTPYDVETASEADSRAALCDVPASSSDGGEAAPPAR